MGNNRSQEERQRLLKKDIIVVPDQLQIPEKNFWEDERLVPGVERRSRMRMALGWKNCTTGGIWMSILIRFRVYR